MKNKTSLIVIFFILLIELYLGFIYYPKYKYERTEATISWDVSGYYMYLPAVFIYKDLKHASYQDSVLNKYAPFPSFDHAAFKHESGNYVMKYSSGQAIVFSPAFLIAHFVTKHFTSYPADGFSYPYQLAISIWTFLISIIGIVVLRKVLLYYFDDISVALTLISIVLASNYLEYAAISGGLTHNSLFTVYAFILFFTIRFYKDKRYLDAAGIGLFCGLAVLIRPTEMLAILIPICWSIASIDDIKNRVQLFISNYIKILLALILLGLIGSIQLFYWKYVSGDFLVYSYQNQGFDWFRPHLIDCLFSAKAGWILYSPVFVFSFIGLYLLYKNYRTLFFGIFLFLLPFTYLCFAWSEWWYGWSIGQRAMIQSYPLWAFALAAFYQAITQQSLIKKGIVYFVLLMFLIYNAWIIRNSHKGGMLCGPEMTKEYFWAIFGRDHIEKDKMVLLDNKDFYSAVIHKTDTIYSNNFNDDTSSVAVLIDSISHNKRLLLVGNYCHSSTYTIPVNEKNKSKWYRIAADITCIEKEWNSWEMPQFIVKFKKGNTTIKQNLIRVNRLLDEGETKWIYLYSKPHRQDYDAIEISFSLMNSAKKIEIDNLTVEKIIE